MSKYRYLCFLFVSMLVPTLAFGAGETVHWMTPHYTFNRTTVIAGARYFAAHCMACHSVSSLRYEYLTADLGMSKSEVMKDIMLPSGAAFKGTINSPMPSDMAAKWLGKPPPDLSHMDRYLGSKFIYTYLLSFYWDPARPSGWNNYVFPMVAMPNILAPWGGTVGPKGQVIYPGKLSPAEYHKNVADVVAFLRYASDPSYFKRMALGPYVIGILLLFTILAYLLKTAYWLDLKKKGRHVGTRVKGS
ncbi:cytochrome c1 [Acidithiobacillus ferriphilus]|uniref:cytochrome c1 n=2 Tax=Acidithiobacillus ferriphilus TaxID=1689834 RepID=UPI0039A62AFF